jgi:translocation and assembly module TamA
MLANIKFRHTTLAQSVRFILNVHDINKFICSSMLLSLYFSPVAHAESISDTSISSSLSQSFQSEIANTQQKNSTDAVAIQPDQTTSSNPQHVADLSSVNFLRTYLNKIVRLYYNNKNKLEIKLRHLNR